MIVLGSACLLATCTMVAALQDAPVADPAAAEQSDAADLAVPAPPPDASLPEIEPLITEEEFEAAIPDLDEDAELEGPLESIEAFERRLANEEAEDAAPADDSVPLGDPALADNDPVEEIGDAPVTDEELIAPLPALADFEVRAVEFAEAEEDAATAEVNYAIEVTGLASADAETDTDMRDMFDDLSALNDADGEAANIAMVAARLTEDSKLLERILASEGWYEATIETRIDRPEVEGEPELVAVLDVTPGTRFAFSDILIEAPPVEPSGLIRDNLALQEGEPIIAARTLAAEANVAVQLPQQGYPFATIGRRDILLDQDTGTGVYTLPVEPGQRSVFGGIRTTGDLAFDAKHVDTLARFERGELYDSRLVDDLRQALVATGLFNTVAVEPEPTGEDAGGGNQYATIVVAQDAGPPRTIAGSAGYGTGQGFRVEASWQHRNLFPPEGALIVNGVAGTREQGAGLAFRRSNAGRRDRAFQLRLDALRSDYDAYEAFTGQLSALVSYETTPIWQKTLTYAYGIRLIGTNEQDFNFELGDLDRRTFFIAGLTGQLGLDFTDSLLDPTRGFKASVLVEPEGSLQNGFTPYTRARIDSSAYYPIGDSFVVAGRVALGTIQGIERFELAPSRRYYAGGGGSVRGFGFQELGPKVAVPNDNFDPDDPDETDDEFLIRPIGGRSLTEAALELRYRFGNFGVVGFVDAGQVYEQSLPQFDDIRFGVGLGGRYYTNFGPLRLDVAVPLDKRPGESSISVYVSIGQAF